MRFKPIGLACAVAMLGSSATAATPKLSGEYILDMTILCQAGIRNNFTQPFEARLETDLGVGNFNDATKQVTFSGFTVFGQTLLLAGMTGGAMHEEPRSFTRSYAQTATTLRFGATEVWRVVYGKADTNNVAQWAFFQRFGGTKPPNNHCAMKGAVFKK